MKLLYIIAILLVACSTGNHHDPDPSNLPPNFHLVSDTPDLYRSGTLQGGLPVLNELVKTYHIRTVVTLDDYTQGTIDADTEEVLAKQAGVTFFIRYPLRGLTPPSLNQLRELAVYLNDYNLRPLLVHCYHGADRTGMAVASFRIIDQGWDADRAISEMRSLGHNHLFYWWDRELYKLEKRVSVTEIFY